MAAQLTANIAVLAAGYILIGVSFGLVYRVYRFLNVGHAIPYVAAPYVVFALQGLWDMPVWLAAGMALLAAGVLGTLLDQILFRTLRRRQAASSVLLMASLGAYIVFENLVALIFGNDVQSLRPGATVQSIGWFGAVLTSAQLVVVGGAALVMLVVLVTLRFTLFGVCYRSVACNPALARTIGMNSERVYLKTAAFGAVLAGLAGILISNDTHMEPTMGLQALLMGIVVVIVGGREELAGCIPAALVIATTQTLSAWQSSGQWHAAIAFLMLLVFLVFRPQGFFGHPLKKAGI